MPGHQVHRLARALGQQHLLGRDHHLVLGQQVAHQLAQRQVALGFAVATQVHFFGGQRAQTPPYAFGEKPVARQPAAAGLEAQRPVLEDALHVPHRVEAVLAGRPRRLQRGVGPPPHEETRMGARDKIALCDQAVIGIDHRVHAYAMGMGKLPYRGQLGSGTQRAVFDELPKALHHLENQRRRRLGIQRKHGVPDIAPATKGLSVQVV